MEVEKKVIEIIIAKITKMMKIKGKMSFMCISFDCDANKGHINKMSKIKLQNKNLDLISFPKK